MHPNLLGQKEYHKLTDQEMADIIGVNRGTYRRKLTEGKFTSEECKKYCSYFKKPFDYLFATNDEIAS